MIIRYRIENCSPLKKYVFDFIFNVLGLNGKEERDGPLDLYYGNSDPRGARLVIRERSEDIVWNELLSGDFTLAQVQRVIPFDFISALGFFLQDLGNKNLSQDSYDEHNRLLFKKSFQYRTHIERIPIVNVYINFLGNIFTRVFDAPVVSRWPQGKTCAIGLSHDVDITGKYDLLSGALFCSRRTLAQNFSFNIVRIRTFLGRLKDKDSDDHWLFNEIMAYEKKLGFTSTFFFAVKNFFDKLASDYDVFYDIYSRRFRDLFANISRHGFEIGLHASYMAYRNVKNFIEEKKILSDLAGCTINGLRHHYWHIGDNPDQSLLFHERAGFQYDSSIAFEDHLGFRRNVALPYYPWTNAMNRSLGVLQLPVFCMDGNLFYETADFNCAFEQVKEYIRTIKACAGLGVLNWHSHTSYPRNNSYQQWAQLYLKILDYLGADSSIWVTNLGNIYSWSAKRFGRGL